MKERQGLVEVKRTLSAVFLYIQKSNKSVLFSLTNPRRLLTMSITQGVILPSVVAANIATILYLPYLSSFFDTVTCGLGFFIVFIRLACSLWKSTLPGIYNKIPIIDTNSILSRDFTIKTSNEKNSLIREIYNYEVLTYKKNNNYCFNTLINISRTGKENIVAIENDGKLVSYYIIATISKDGYDAIVSGENTINDLPEKYFYPEERAYAVYICNIGIINNSELLCGRDREIRSVTLTLFWAKLFNVLQKNPTIRMVLYKPITMSEKANATKSGFSPVADNEENPLYLLNTDHLPSSNAAIQKFHSKRRPLSAVLPLSAIRTPTT